MSKIIINRGISASGKTTWSTLMRDTKGYVIVSRDAFRLSILGSPQKVAEYWKSPNEDRYQLEEKITQLQQQEICRALSQNKNVIVDDTHLRLKYCDMPARLGLDYDAEIELKTFDIEVEEAIRRDQRREMSVGEETIRRQYGIYKSLTWGLEEVIDRAKRLPKTNWIYPKFQVSKILQCVPKNNYNPEARPAIITDIDGNLSERTLKGKMRSYYSPQLEEMLTDQPRQDIIFFVNQMVGSGIKNIIFTGRKEMYRDVTKRWLDACCIHYHELVMRRNDDNRPDDEVKYEMLQNLGDRYLIRLVTDDRPKVTQMYNEVGLTVLNSRKDINDIF